MVQVTHIRERSSGSEETRDVHYTLIGFTVELDDVDVSKVAIGDFAGALVGSGPIYHALRLEDPGLQDELAEFDDASEHS